MVLPSSLDFSAAKKIIRISPIAKKFTINRENQSIAAHRGSLENSREATHPIATASYPVFIGVIVCMPRVSWIAAVESLEEKPLTKAVIKISEILNAATVITGAKIIPMTPLRLRYSSSHFIFTKFLKLSLRMIKGDATI